MRKFAKFNNGVVLALEIENENDLIVGEKYEVTYDDITYEEITLLEIGDTLKEVGIYCESCGVDVDLYPIETEDEIFYLCEKCFDDDNVLLKKEE